MKQLLKSRIQSIIRIGIGSVFIIAAVLKLISIDEFEIYIYSFNMFNFITTTFVSRLLVVGELILGIFLVFKIYYKITWHATLATLLAFSLFLVYVALFREDDNCHCFGELVELNPIESIIKNIVFVVVLMIIGRKQTNDRYRRGLSLLIATGALLIVFIVSPPDSIYNKIYSDEKEICSNDLYESFDDVVMINFENDSIRFDSDAVFAIGDGRQMIAVVSSGCKYCKLGVKRLSMLREKGESDVDEVYVFIWGSPDSIMKFREETMTDDYSYWHIMPNEAISITYGRFPIFIIMENNEIVSVGDFRSL